MELQDKAIAIRAVTTSETHIKGYVLAVGGDPSKPQSPPSEGEGEPHSPLNNPHPSGETPHHVQVELGNLIDHELCQLMEDLCQEITLCELNAPPRSPPPTPGGHPLGSGNPSEDEQEVTFLRGGGWVPPGQTSPSPVSTQPDGWWIPLGPPPQSHILLHLIQMWGA